MLCAATGGGFEKNIEMYHKIVTEFFPQSAQYEYAEKCSV